MPSCPCTACKLRKTKCDRKTPICGGCQSIKVPPELCQYKRLKGIMKEKDSRKCLSKAKLENQKLKKQQFQLCSFLGANLKNVNTQKKPKIHQTRPRNALYMGPLSWAAPIASESHIQDVMDHIQDTLLVRSNQVSEMRRFSQNLLESDQMLNSIKGRLTLVMLGVEEFDNCGIIQDLINFIEVNLAPYDILRAELELYFMFESVHSTIFMINKSLFWNRFNEIIKRSNDGSIKVDVALPQEIEKLTFLVLLIPIIVRRSFQGSHKLNNPLSNYNDVLLVAYGHTLSSVLIYINAMDTTDKNSRKLVNLEHIQARCLFQMFDLLAPDDKLNSVAESSDVLLLVRRGVSMAKALRLHEDIDYAYSDYSSEYREGLKSAWYYLALQDIFFAYETGIQSKIPPDELSVYPEFDNVKVAAIKVIGTVLYDFKAIESTNPEYLTIDFVDFRYVSQLKNFIKKEYGKENLEKIISIIDNYDFDNPMEYQKLKFMGNDLLSYIDVHYCLHSLYCHCLEKAREQKDMDLIKRHKILVMKNALLLCTICPLILRCIQRMCDSKNHEMFEPILANLTMFIRARKIFRRAGIHGAAEVFCDLSNISSEDIESSLNIFPEKEDAIVNQILENDQNLVRRFSISELEDFEIEEDHEALLGKFNIFTNNMYGLLTVRQALQDTMTSLTNRNYNMTAYRMNTTFYTIAKINSALIVLSYKKGRTIDFENISVNRGNLKDKNNNNTQDFDFKEIFKRAFEFTSSSIEK